MKFDYTLHITRSGDRTYSVQMRDNGGDTPDVGRRAANLDWKTLWKAIPKAIEQRENKKIADYKAALDKPAPPKNWVPTAAGQPNQSTPAPAPAQSVAPAPVEAAKAPKPNRYIKTPASGAGASMNPNPKE